ncbi:Uncharacterized protein PBTT_07282 [Plasmodiophora brassicae]|uniref:Uncharacterized protein n=1 Tax=Plasmodiophora brassicae TaxID=37360 RepID=A0A3P3YH93_PLABS|nr:unnamed protein product [Plasmodiophora brassicae]
MGDGTPSTSSSSSTPTASPLRSSRTRRQQYRLPIRRLTVAERIQLASKCYYVNVPVADRPSRYFLRSAPVMTDAILKAAYKRVYEDRLLLMLYNTDREFRAAVAAGQISSSAAKEHARRLRRHSNLFQAGKSRVAAARSTKRVAKKPTRGLQRDDLDNTPTSILL